jgi:hypothetical protein
LSYYGIPQSNVDRIRPGFDEMPPFIRNDNKLLDNRQQPPSNRRAPKLRFSGGGAANTGASYSGSGGLGAAAITFGNAGINANLLTPQKGSFQRLKELVWTERAKELQQQRKNEEMAVRAAILKDITNGQQ